MAAAPSETVLEETPGRVLIFFRGLAKHPQLQTLLAQNGYTPERHAQGWQLLMAAVGAPSGTGSQAPAVTPAQQAIMALDSWDEAGFTRIDAALEASFPEQHAFVFADGLSASVGPAAVVGVQTLLERLDALESGKDRPKGSRKNDLAALHLLTERGITKQERSRLASLVEQAMTLDPPPAPEDTKREEALRALHVWYRDWSKTAHVVVKKRVYLIALGLAKRRAVKKKADPTPS